jgi:glycosyltransferase involved in cell wall biosynthesis
VDGGEHTGIDRVNLQYAKWVRSNGGSLCIRNGNRMEMLTDSHGAALLEKKPVAKHKPTHFAIGKLRHLQSKVTHCLGTNGPPPLGATLINPSHAWLERLDLWSWLAARGNQVVSFIHDLIPIEYPEYARPEERSRHMRRLNNVIRHGRGIVVNSRYTEDSLRAYAGKHRVSLPPVAVMPIGHALEPVRYKLPEGISAPYFLLLGTIEPRKNHLLLLTLWRELALRLGPATPTLVVAGRRGWECEQVIDLLERCEAIHPYVRELNSATDETVSSLIRGAQALVMPSFAEGFGMPVQEALAVGTPVIASPLLAYFEVAGQIPDYVEPYDGVRWLELLTDYSLPDSLMRARQIERIQGFQEATWDGHFEQFAAFLESLHVSAPARVFA